MNDPGQRPIFFDESRRRWNLVSYFFIFGGILGVIASLAFAVQIIFSPQLPAISLAASKLGLAPSLLAEKVRPLGPAVSPRLKAVLGPHTHARLRYVLSRNHAVQEAKRKLTETIQNEARPQVIPAAAIAPGHVTATVRAAFFENNDIAAVDSLTQHIGQTTHLFPVWLLLTPGGKGIQSIAAFSDKSAAAAETRADTNDDIAVDPGPRPWRCDPAADPEL